MEVNKVESVVPQYKPIPSDKPGVKRYQQGDLIMEISREGKEWIYIPTGKVVARGPSPITDTFEKNKSINEKGQVLNKDGIIND